MVSKAWNQIWSQLPLIGPTQLVTWHPHTLAWYRPSSGPPGALKGPVLAQNVPFGAPEVPGGPLEDQIWLQCNYLDTPHGYIPTKNISGPKKGHFGPKLALLGPLGAQKRAETRPKCVVTMSLTLAEQPVAVRTKFCPRGPSWDLWVPKRDIWGQNWPFWGPRGPEEGRYQAKVCGCHVTNCVGPISGSWDQIWPPRLSEDLRGPKKGLLGPK